MELTSIKYDDLYVGVFSLKMPHTVNTLSIPHLSFCVTVLVNFFGSEKMGMFKF